MGQVQIRNLGGRLWCIAAVAAGGFCGSAAAETWFVPLDFFRIQDAIDAAADGDEIIVEPGLYREAIDFKGKSLHVRSEAGAELTTIDGSWRLSSVVTFEGGTGAVLEGFTVTGGIGTMVGGSRLGGGVILLDASATVRECIIEGNTVGVDTSGSGGGVAADGSTVLTLESSILRENMAEYGGGMIAWSGAQALIHGCEFISNDAGRDGGGLSASRAVATVVDCSFVSNSSINGGAIHIRSDSNVSVDRCLLQNNRGTRDGGGILIDDDSSFQITNCVIKGNAGAIDVSSGGVIANCTIVDNAAFRDGGGVIANGSAPITVSVFNSIVRGNSPTQLYEYRSARIMAEFNNVEGGKDGEGNIDADPAFAYPEAENYRLTSGSPCIDAGNSLLVPPGVDLDYVGLSRIVDDVGKFDTGVGDPAVVDMGAYEFHSASVFALTVVPLPIPPESTFSVVVTNARANAPVWMAYSTTGRGATYIQPLGVTLDLDQARQMAGPRSTDLRGNAVWRDLPSPAGAKPVWFQAVQSGRKSNVIETRLGE